MKNKETLKLKGRVEIYLIKNGKIIEKEVKDNLIVSVGKTRVAHLIGGTNTTYFNYIAIGTGTNEPSESDTALQNEVKRQQATVSNDNNTEKFEATFEFGSAESYAITELGIFDSSSGGTMLNRLKFTAKSVDVDTSLFCRVSISVS